MASPSNETRKQEYQRIVNEVFGPPVADPPTLIYKPEGYIFAEELRQFMELIKDLPNDTMIQVEEGKYAPSALDETRPPLSFKDYVPPVVAKLTDRIKRLESLVATLQFQVTALEKK